MNDQTESKDLRRAERSHGMTPFEEMNRFFDSFFPPGWMRGWHGGWPSWPDIDAPFKGRTPRVDVIDRDEEVVVRAELPGVKKDDLDVSLSENQLIIKAASKDEHDEEKGDYHHREITRGELTRTIRLPTNVDANNAKASFADGVLELSLPKSVPSKRQSIKVD